jgi:hypothetical protein
MEAVQNDLTTHLSNTVTQKSVIGPSPLRGLTQCTLAKPILLIFHFISAVSFSCISDLRVVDFHEVARPKSCMHFLLFYKRSTTSPLWRPWYILSTLILWEEKILKLFSIKFFTCIWSHLEEVNLPDTKIRKHGFIGLILPGQYWRNISTFTSIVVFLRNTGNHPQAYTASQHRSPQPTSSPPWEPHISDIHETYQARTQRDYFAGHLMMLFQLQRLNSVDCDRKVIMKL